MDDLNADVPSVLAELGIGIERERGEWLDAFCPFHDDGKHPGFSIAAEGGGWVCRHTGKRGGIVELVVQIRGCSYVEARALVKRFGLRVDTAEVIARMFPRPAGLTPPSDLDEWAADFDRLPSEVPRYFLQRGFSMETAARYDVRYDKERARMLFPVRDEIKRLVGFVARRLPGEGAGPKYQYPRGFRRCLFPLDHFWGTWAILVEGSLDAMWMMQHGLPALATLGPPTDVQVEWLIANTVKVTVMFDNDGPGREQTNVIVSKLAPKMAVCTAAVPDPFKDVQDMTNEQIRAALNMATPAVYIPKGV
jgi:DNA primase